MFQQIKLFIYRLLRRSEKYTKTDMVYLAKGGFWLTLGQIVSSGSAFLLAIAFANLLPKEIFGQYKYVLSIVSILSITTLSGMNTSITRAVARDFTGSFIPVLKTKIKWGTLGAIASLLVAGYYFVNGNNNLSLSFLTIAVFIPFHDTFQMYQALLQGKKLFKKSTKYLTISKIFATTLLIVALFLTNNLILVLLTYFVSWTLIRFIFLTVTLKKINPPSDCDQVVIAYGKHLSLIKSIAIIATSLNGIVLFHFIGSQSLAIFSLAIAPIEQVRNLLKNINPLLMPKIAKDEWQAPSIKNFLKKITPVFLLIIGGIFIYYFIAPWVFKIFFPKYLESVAFSQIYAFSLIFTVVNIIQHTILKAKRKMKEIYIINFVDIGLNIFLVIPMIYFWGIWGLVIAIITIKIIESILIFYLIYKNKIFGH